MAEDNKKNRIEEEYSRLKVLFEPLEENKKSLADPLIQNSAFMKVTLEDLQATIKSDNMTERYQNGERQSGLKQSSSLQAYNALIKNYAVVQKQLFQLLPADAPRPVDFMKRICPDYYDEE